MRDSRLHFELSEIGAFQMPCPVPKRNGARCWLTAWLSDFAFTCRFENWLARRAEDFAVVVGRGGGCRHGGRCGACVCLPSILLSRTWPEESLSLEGPVTALKVDRNRTTCPDRRPSIHKGEGCLPSCGSGDTSSSHRPSSPPRKPATPSDRGPTPNA